MKKLRQPRRSGTSGAINTKGLSGNALEEANFLTAFRDLKSRLGHEDAPVFRSQALRASLQLHQMHVGAACTALRGLKTFFRSMNKGEPQLRLQASDVVLIRGSVVYFLPLAVKLSAYLQGVDVLRLILGAGQVLFGAGASSWTLVADCSLWNSDTMATDVAEALFQSLSMVPVVLERAFVLNLPKRLHKLAKRRAGKHLASKVAFCELGGEALLEHLGEENVLVQLGGRLEATPDMQQPLVGESFFNEALWNEERVTLTHTDVGLAFDMRCSTDLRMDDAGVHRNAARLLRPTLSVEDMAKFQAKDVPVEEESMTCLYCAHVLGRSYCRCGRIENKRILEEMDAESISYSDSE